ncbi:hypothetical protein QR680_012432 [Steinernema hermaphroditum]|uniref:Uncharacterized protein n=1 Tax=Steinernema hermaphroditum TaxID=289476 RepID=A0AA39I4R7_9BILA|nr:hypothetical protein QR680_012432 [Steinernema hermaphroditum]
MPFEDVSWAYNSRYGCKNLIVTPASPEEEEEDVVYTWSKLRANYSTKKSVVKGTYACTGCRSVLKGKRCSLPVVVIDVEANVFLSDPLEPSRPHVCQPRRRREIEGMQIRREAIAEMKLSGGKTAEAYKKILDTVGQSDEGVKEARTKQTLRRARARGSMLPTLSDLPPLEGR